ncbi:MAG: IS200/IS605 family transposase [Candidatus Omnitrophica bacterium]|nr:hypothetical protein [bacterium]NUN98190.1 IS200/IS605 family transposase [Candidatus Omnitrophota bacterium]
MPNSHTEILIHFVFGTRGRLPSIHEECREPLVRYMAGILRNLNCEMLAGKAVADHAHLLVRLPPSLSVSQLVRRLKASSSKWVHETFGEEAGFWWQDGYGAFSVSKSQASKVIQYIEDQDVHHAETVFTDEYRALIKRHGISYEERDLIQ